jgi:hypothetical protein
MRPAITDQSATYLLTIPLGDVLLRDDAWRIAHDDWHDATERLLQEYETDFANDTGTACQSAGLLQLAADFLWEEQGPAASWQTLDATALYAFLREHMNHDLLLTHLHFELFAFYCFLAKFGHVTAHAALRVQQQLKDSAPAGAQALWRKAQDRFQRPTGGRVARRK